MELFYPNWRTHIDKLQEGQSKQVTQKTSESKEKISILNFEEAQKSIKKYIENSLKTNQKYREIKPKPKKDPQKPTLTTSTPKKKPVTRKKTYLTKPQKTLKVFMCHSSDDKPVVRKLYQRLSKEAWIEPWLDEKKLDIGDKWDIEIEKEVKKSDVVIVCISTNSITKEGFVQKEIKFALDIADEKPDGTIYIIPLKLERCDVPGRLSSWHWGNYYEKGSYKKLLHSLKKRAQGLGISYE